MSLGLVNFAHVLITQSKRGYVSHWRTLLLIGVGSALPSGVGLFHHNLLSSDDVYSRWQAIGGIAPCDVLTDDATVYGCHVYDVGV